MIDVWINTNEQANDDPSEHFWDVEVALKTDKRTVVFRCDNKELAIKLESAISECDDVELG